MGLFDRFKSKNQNYSNEKTFDQRTTTASTSKAVDSPDCYVDSSTVAEDERKYYQPDNYYTYYSYAGTYMSSRVITFEERKGKSYPSARGLYVAEIMLLDYCRKGNYPKPKSGYPGLWWFQYGIRDVGHALESLEKRGFLKWASKAGNIKALKVDELKLILSNAGLPTDGKKAELIDRIISEISEEEIYIQDYVPKYELTELGKTELEENGYVPYMHSHKHKTNEDERFGDTFNVWTVNKLFPDGNAAEWRKVVGKIEKKKFGVDMANAMPEEKKKPVSADDFSDRRNEIREFLKSKQTDISRGIKTSGDGFDEESKGLDYISIGKDKEALVQLYISIGKGFDAPALYRETSKLLRKYKMFEEEFEVINAGINNVPKTNKYHDELIRRKDKLLKLMKEQRFA